MMKERRNESQRKHQKMSHFSSHGWSNLPSKIINNISKHLKTRQQIVQFKRVCRRWNKHSVHLPVNLLSFSLPLTIPISSSCNNTLPFVQNSKHSLLLQSSSIYLITPSNDSQPSLHPWMIMVEESNPGRLRLRHPLTAKRVTSFPPTLDMSRFRADELAKGYTFKHSDSVHKVILCSSSSSCLEVLVLFLEGVLGKLTVKLSDIKEEEEEEDRYCWKKLKVRQNRQFYFQYLDDVIKFKGKYLALDRKGKLYELNIEAMNTLKVLISEPICRGDMPSNRRKRLVVDNDANHELYLVTRVPKLVKSTRFEVYKFNENFKRWDYVQNLGSERVLFVGVDHCFFAKAKYFPGFKGNCIVFSANCFTQYNGRNAPDESLFGDEDVEVGVHRFGGGNNFVLLSSDNAEFCKVIWPTPMWVCPKSECKDEEMDSSSYSQQELDEGSNSSSVKSLSEDHKEGMLTDSSGESSSEHEEDEDILPDSSSFKPSKENESNEITDSDEDDEEVHKNNSSNEQTYNFETHFSNPSNEQTYNFETHFSTPPSPVEFEVQNLGTSKMDSQKNGECSAPDFSKERVYNANSTPVTPSANLQTSSTVKFEGVDINSELLPTLQTISNKHGSLIGEDTIRNKAMRACALESVANLVITLQNTTGKSLSNKQADEIQSTLSDLQRVGLKVDWLVPAVEKTSKLQKHKPLIESISMLNKRKAEIDEEEKKFLAHTTKVKQEIEEDMACLSATIPFPELIDLDDCLGGGLF